MIGFKFTGGHPTWASRIRPSGGAVLSLIIVSALVVVIFGLGSCYLLFLFGGSRESNNAHDAGTLSVATKAPSVQIGGTAAENEIYSSVSEANNYSLKSINRVWGHCLLTMLNSRSMNMTGNGTAASMANEDRAWQAANSLSNRLSDSLNHQENLEPFFKSVSNSNSIRMLGQSRELTPRKNWHTACMNRGEESNMRLFTPQLPPRITVSDLQHDPTNAGDSAVLTKSDNNMYLKGYYPISFGNDRYVNFVSYEFKKQPHLVALRSFHADTLTTRPYPEWPKAVPNSFNCLSKIPDQRGYKNLHDAAALANIMHPQNLSLPNGFVRISLDQDVWYWFPNFMPGVPIFSENVPKSNTGLGGAWLDFMHPTFPPSFFTAFGQYGHQYYDSDGRRTLYQALYALGGEGHSMYGPVTELIFNRCNQIKPNTSWESIVALLKSVEINQAGDSFVIGRDQGGQLIIVNEKKADVARLSQFVNRANHADGKPFHRVGQNSFSKNNVYGIIDWIWTCFVFFCMYVPHPVGGGTVWRHTLDVTPGTGVNGAVLEIRQHDNVYAFWGGGSGQQITMSDIPVSGAGGCGCM